MWYACHIFGIGFSIAFIQYLWAIVYAMPMAEWNFSHFIVRSASATVVEVQISSSGGIDRCNQVKTYF